MKKLLFSTAAAALLFTACKKDDNKGSGDSYALRNHAVKSILPRIYPENAFPPKYKLKDLDYLLELGKELKSPLRSMQLAHSYYDDAVRSGYGSRYFTVVREVVERESGVDSPDPLDG